MSTSLSDARRTPAPSTRWQLSNGTAALHIALKLAGGATRRQVLMPALSFVAAANAVARCGAVPHFVDSSPDTMGMDPIALSEYLITTKRTYISWLA